MQKKSIINFSIFLIIINIFSGAVFAGRSWEYYYKKGLLEYKKEMYNDALENLFRALEKNPSSYESANMIAYILQRNNKESEAMDYLDKSLQINDSQPEIHCMAGELNESYLNYKLSYYHYQKSVDIDPAFIMGHYNLVRYYIIMNNRENADRHFRICDELGSNTGGKYFNFAFVQEKDNNDEGSIELYMKAIEANPVMVDAYFRLSEIYRRKLDYKNAVLNLEKIKGINPDFKRLHLYLGHLYLTDAVSLIAGKSRDLMRRNYLLIRAVNNFEEAIRRWPDNSELYFFLSLAYEYLGNEEKSLAAFSRGNELEANEK